ncbi:MAG: ribonuclease R [Clostridia bacterium]
MDKIYTDILNACNKPTKTEEVCRKLPQYSKKQIKKAIDVLINKTLLLSYKSKTFANRDFFSVIEATFCATDKGYGFAEPVEPLPNGRDVFIPEKFTKDAWHGDTILVKLIKSRYKRDKKGDRQEGEIIKVVKRTNSFVNGTLDKQDGVLFVKPDIKKYPLISIDDTRANNAQVGDKVAVKVRFFGNFEYMPQGEIKEVFGVADTLIASENSILHSHGISREFPPMVALQTQSISTSITEDMFGDRLDLTDKMIFTIDGDYSKDFDDAVSLDYLENGNLMLGVHIADVSNYVTEGSPLDLEAFDRGTSVYFANQVVPMLPFELSNGICSLNPNENRFSLTAFIELDNNCDVVSSKFHKTVINSKYRLTYNNVNGLLDGDPDLCVKYAEIVDVLVKMNSIAEKMEQKRFSRGALDLDIPESYIITDESGEPADVKLRSRGKSEKLIEQFMVLANESVAEYMCKNEIPSVYRVHEAPNMEKLQAFAELSRLFNYKISDDELTNPVALQAVLNGCKGKPEHKLLSTMLLRSLARARYEEECIGHNGLASEFYLHFTSPIRRYPDLVVHRMLSKKIENERFTFEDANFVEAASIQSTDREKHADDASRDIEKLYFAKYMSKFIGDEFDARVSGVQNFGVFVELENTIEGLIRTDNLPQDNYEYDEKHVKLVGKNSKVVYNIGKPVRVKLVNASASNGQIDFIISK